MGYDIHIVRRKDWDDPDGDSDISLEEWLAYVQSDNELELTNGYYVRFPDAEPVFHHMQGFCYWTAYPTKGQHKPYLDYGRGTISTKNPDDFIIQKMITIADKLNARVVGDEGEFYGK